MYVILSNLIILLKLQFKYFRAEKCMQLDIIFVRYLNGLLENSNFAFNCLNFLCCLLLSNEVIEKVELIIVQDL